MPRAMLEVMYLDTPSEISVFGQITLHSHQTMLRNVFKIIIQLWYYYYDNLDQFHIINITLVSFLHAHNHSLTYSNIHINSVRLSECFIMLNTKEK